MVRKEKQKSKDLKTNKPTNITFSFCCDLTAASFSCSLFNLAFSSACCRKAIAASSIATSCCCSCHCCSYNDMQKHTHTHTQIHIIIGKGRRKQTTVHQPLKTSSCAPAPRCQSVAWTFEELPFTLHLGSAQKLLKYWIIMRASMSGTDNKPCMLLCRQCCPNTEAQCCQNVT